LIKTGDLIKWTGCDPREGQFALVAESGGPISVKILLWPDGETSTLWWFDEEYLVLVASQGVRS